MQHLDNLSFIRGQPGANQPAESGQAAATNCAKQSARERATQADAKRYVATQSAIPAQKKRPPRTEASKLLDYRFGLVANALG